MPISAKFKCRITAFFANLKCPKCFSKKLTPCEGDPDDKAKCEECGCEFEFNSKIPDSGME